MAFPKMAAVAGGVAICSSIAFAWSITGKVTSAGSGRALANVQISSFNFASVTAKTDAQGAFSISDEQTGLNESFTSASQVFFDGNILSVNNVNAKTLKIYAINALGKVTYQRTLHNIFGSASFDMAKNQSATPKFIRISIDNATTNYIIGGKGVLLKEGDPLPAFQFALDGYKSTVYQMTQEVETDVQVKMERGNDGPGTSSIVEPKSSESATPTSSEAALSSSSKQEEVVDCSGKTMKAGTSITVDGRKIDIKFPNGYKGDKPAPLLVYYHPIGGSSSNADGSSTVKAALADGAIVAAPNGGKTPAGGMMGGVQAWNVGPCCTDEDDVTFSKHFIAEIQEKACVDPKRIYASGFSMGGGMSNYAGCFMADIYAAAAPSAFDLAKEIVDAGKCKPARPFPILNFRGTSDNIVMYDGGLSQVVQGKPITFMGAVNNMKEWAKMNGCKDSPKQNTPGNGCQMYEDCEGGVKVGLCTIQGGSHAEGDGQMGWNFLKQFTMP